MQVAVLRRAGTIGRMNGNQPNYPPIALLTDFGLSDAYVGTMKGVMLGICPGARLVDLTHSIAPQNVQQAAFVLLTAYRYFPSQTVFLVVVDPGVGTVRQPVAVRTAHGVYVAPDNGVLSYVLDAEAVEGVALLSDSAYQLASVSQTFHGRDLFAPAAAHLARGVTLAALGPAPATLQRLPPPHLVLTRETISGTVLHIDHFGNIITSIGRMIWIDDDVLELQPQFGAAHEGDPLRISAAKARLEFDGKRTPTLRGIRRTYGAVPPGNLTLLVGSSGFLEVGRNQGNAAHTLGIELGAGVILHRA